MNKFDVEAQYQQFLNKMGLSEKTMNPEQKIQVKIAFYAGFGQMLFVLYTDLTSLDDDTMSNTIDIMFQQIRTVLHEYL